MDNIKNIVSGVIGKMAAHEIKESEKIERIWENILEKCELKHTRLEGVKDNILFILIDSPAWLYQMRIKKRKLLIRIQQEIEEIKDIKFKIGKINE